MVVNLPVVLFPCFRWRCCYDEKHIRGHRGSQSLISLIRAVCVTHGAYWHCMKCVHAIVLASDLFCPTEVGVSSLCVYVRARA